MVTHTFSGSVKKFDMKNPWYYVEVPSEITSKLSRGGAWGMLPVCVTLGRTTWDTSILPMGDGKKFIALKAKVRKKEGISLGDTVKLEFSTR